MIYFEIRAEIRTIDCEEVVTPPCICVCDTIFLGAVNQLKMCANPNATISYVKVYIWGCLEDRTHFLLKSFTYYNENDFWQSVREAIK